MKKRLKINGILMFLAFLSLIAFPNTFFRGVEEGPFGLTAQGIGLALVLLGQLIRVCARGFKAEHSQQGNALITSGPYAFARNPMYLGILFIGLGIVTMLFQWWVACVFVIIFIIRYVSLIFTEEKKLGALFPGDFSAYKQRAPRIFPSLPAILKAGITEYLPFKFSWLYKEIGSIWAVLLFVLFLELWRGMNISGKSAEAYIKEGILLSAVIAVFLLLINYLDKRSGK